SCPGRQGRIGCCRRDLRRGSARLSVQRLHGHVLCQNPREATYTMPDLALTKLDDLAVLAVRGRDALAFLQGQLSQDVNPLQDGETALAGLHNPQGRCIAVLRLLRMTRE